MFSCILLFEFHFFPFLGRYVRVNWKEKNVEKPIQLFAPDDNKHKHINFPAIIGFTWLR